MNQTKDQLFKFFDEHIKDPELFHFEIPTIMSQDIEEEAKVKDMLTICYEDIRSIIETYIDMENKHYAIISLWIIGTYFHHQFNSYPYLYINAMRGSGKTRLLGLISELSNQGTMQNSMREAVLFRTKGTLCIDEFEGLGRKGFENLRELLNSAYKKGVMVKRMKKTFTNQEEAHVVEEFDVYRPIVMANIAGIDDVLGDRCIKIIMEKSVNERKTKLVENYRNLQRIKFLKHFLSDLKGIQCSLCSVCSPEHTTILWNSYVLEQSYTLTTLHTLTTQTTLTTLKLLKISFEKIKKSDINGRDLELSMPLLVMSLWIEGGVKEGFFDEILKILTGIFEKKKQEESIENLDISLVDFVSQMLVEDFFIPVKKITEEFRSFLQTTDEWITPRWMGRALTRLKLVREKKRLARGIEIRLDFAKAREKIMMFK